MIFEVETNLYGDRVLSKTLSDQDTKIEAVQGKVSVIMTDTEYKEYQDGGVTMVSKLSTVEQNISGLTRQYSDLKTEYDTVSGQYTSLDSKVTTVSETVDGLSANISSVKSTADGNTTKITSLQATTDELSSTISSVQTNLEQEITDAKSEIKQTTDSISTEVSKKVGEDEVISKINQSAESVTINAAKIKLDGWTLDNDSITNDTGTYRVGMWNSTNSNKDFLVVRVKDSEGNYTYPFYVRGDGTCYAGNFTAEDYIYVDGNSKSYIRIPYTSYASESAYTEISKNGLRLEAKTYASSGNSGFQVGPYVMPGTSTRYDLPFAVYIPYQVQKYSDRYCGVTINTTDSNTSYAFRIRKYNSSGTQSQSIQSPSSLYFYVGSTAEASYTNTSMTIKDGTKSMAMSTDDYGTRLLYCYELASPMYGDIGEGEIAEDGLCYIMLDPILKETIATDENYQVFLQAYGDGKLYVKERNADYFVVAGTAGLNFGWEIKAKQIHNSQKRLDEEEINGSNSYTGVEDLQNYGDVADDYLTELQEGRLSET